MFPVTLKGPAVSAARRRRRCSRSCRLARHSGGMASTTWSVASVCHSPGPRVGSAGSGSTPLAASVRAPSSGPGLGRHRRNSSCALRRSVTRRPLASIQPTIRCSAVYSSMGASSGMYAMAAAEPLATPVLVPRRQFQKVKGSLLRNKPRGSARFVAGTLQAGGAALHWSRVLPRWSVAAGHRGTVQTPLREVQQPHAKPAHRGRRAGAPAHRGWNGVRRPNQPRPPPVAAGRLQSTVWEREGRRERGARIRGPGIRGP